MEIIETLKGKIEPLLEEESIELIDISLRRRGKRGVFRILVDKIRPAGDAEEGETQGEGITLSECVRLNRKISALLDQENLIEGRFVLEVSSPGIDRPLVNRKDFLRCLGRTVRIISSGGFGGGVLIGKIKRLEGDELILETAGGECVHIPLPDIVKAKQVVSFR